MISIIVIVKNDRKIEFLLSKLNAFIKSVNVEIIVVDSSNGLLNDIKNKHNNVKWIYFINKDNNKTTIPEQRNIGIKKARGNIIVFIDSDCIPHKDWLNNLVYPIKKEHEYIVAGHVINSNNDSVHSLEFNKHLKKKYLDEAPTMNIAISKKIFDEIGLFDPKFQCGEDVDLLWRAKKLGYKIRLEQKAIIYHDLGSFKNELRRMFEYGGARVNLYRKHTYRIKFFVGSEIFKILYPLFWILFPITFWFHLYPLIWILFYIKNFHRNFLISLKTIILKTSYGLGMLINLLIQN